MKFIKRAKRGNILLSVGLFLTGLILAVGYTFSSFGLCLLSGILLTLLGLCKLAGYFSRDPYRLAFQFDYAYGCLSLIAGCLMLVFSETVLAFIFPFWGLYTLFDGVLKLQTARDARLFGMEHWWMILLLAAATCIAGIIVFVQPESTATSQRFLGLSCCVSGIQNTAVIAYTVRTPKKKAPNTPTHNDKNTPKGNHEKNK